jgi:hypothetical protein
MPSDLSPTSATETNAATTDERAPFERALDFLGKQLDETAPQGETKTDAKPPQGESKPGKQDAKPEQKPDDAKAKRDAVTLLEKANARQAYADRQLSKLETERTALQEQKQTFESTIKSLTSLESMVAYLAKSNNRSEDDYWTEFIEHVQNKGTSKGDESAAMREVKRLRQELADEKASKTKAKEAETETQQAEAAVKAEQQWQDAALQMVTDDDGAERWPALATSVSPAILKASALAVVKNYYDQTGVVATIEQVLDALEKDQASKLPPTRRVETKPEQGAAVGQPANAAKSSAPIRVPTNEDSATTTTDTRTLSPQEREELAVQKLRALLDS